jgi:hypothetical protein
MKLTLADKKISVTSSRWGFILFILCGIFFLSTGIRMHGQLNIIDHVLIGMGIIFASGGMLFLFNTRSYTVEIDPDKGIVLIFSPGRNRMEPLELPIGYFKNIVIQRSLTKRSSGRQSVSRYEISLMSDSGSSLHISDFTDRDKAVAYGKELQKIFRINLITEEDSIRDLLKQRTVHGDRTIKVTLSEKSRLISIPEGESIKVKWNCRNTLIQNFVLLVIIYGFFHLIHFAVVPSTGNTVVSVVLYGISALLILIVVSIIVMNGIGTYYLIISDTTIQYYINLFGKKTGNRSMNKNEIGMIKNSIGGQNNSIQIMSTKGLAISSKLMDAFSKQASPVPDLSMVGAIYSLKDEMMDINASSLSMREKWYIESLILRK